MVTDKQIINEIYQLPENLKVEVLHYINFLKSQQHQTGINEATRKRRFGSAKGKYKLSRDFDAPLDDFKEYM